MQYNFLDDNFTVYSNVETPTVQLSMPLMNEPLDISDWAIGVSDSGTPIVKPNLNKGPKMINDNPDRVDVIPYSGDDTDFVSYDVNEQHSSNKNLKGNQKIAYNFFISKGLQPHQAAGIVGNLMGESKLNPSAVNPTSKAFGIAQWLGDRKKKLFAKYGDKPTIDQQLEFVWEELNTSEKRAFDRLLQTQSVEEATNSFMKHFERPSAREMAQSINNRIKFSRSLLS